MIFVNNIRIKMPYDEVYFQRLEEENPEEYKQLKTKK